MKKLSIMAQYFLLMGIFISIVNNSLGQSRSKSEQSNYMIARYVIGSGGIMGATGGNHIHFATAGEPIVGITLNANNFLLSGYWHLGAFGSTDIENPENIIIPATFRLHQNYPNPFNPQTTIEYDLPKESRVTVEILNIMGQRIRLLLHSQQQTPGFKQVIWNGCDDRGELMGSGIYIYRVSVFDVDNSYQNAQMLFQQSKKMLFVK